MSMRVCTALENIPEGWFLADCAVSGGTLEAYIGQLLQIVAGKLCVRLQPVFMDFELPCGSGTGIVLGESDLRRMYNGQSTYFSASLCTNYFTCISGDFAHVILFDTAQSLKEKYILLERRGVPMVFMEDKSLLDTLQKMIRN